ncbi:MAG: glycosyltransferase [Alphaproteobacteria bacterium]
MTTPDILRVAALVDLPRTPQSGGHVKCWERLAEAAAQADLPVDLTVYFSGPNAMEVLSAKSRLRHLPPVFSTANLKFLPYMPDTTDLAPYHPALARELTEFDIIHTTDCYFAFAQTAERISRSHSIPLVTSFHTDTPSYTRIFTKQTIDKLLGAWPILRDTLIDTWQVPERQGRTMEKKMRRHLEQCQYAIMTREEDHTLAESLLGQGRVSHLRLGIDKSLFGPHRADREGLERDYLIPPNRVIALFVGRVDIGKNIYVLTDAIEKLVKEGLPLHLIVAGVGPAEDDVRNRLKNHVSMLGFVKPDELARLYASVDVVTLSSEVEIRSMVGVEAMASSCPALVSSKSGVMDLFHNTPGMRRVESGAQNWADALRDFVTKPNQHQMMKSAAKDYSDRYLASWQDVLEKDLLSIWQKAFAKKQHKVA